MNPQGPGWHNDRYEHSLAQRGIRTRNPMVWGGKPNISKVLHKIREIQEHPHTGGHNWFIPPRAITSRAMTGDWDYYKYIYMVLYEEPKNEFLYDVEEAYDKTDIERILKEKGEKVIQIQVKVEHFRADDVDSNFQKPMLGRIWLKGGEEKANWQEQDANEFGFASEAQGKRKRRK